MPEQNEEQIEVRLGPNSTVTAHAENVIQLDDFRAALRERFGPDPMRWAFVCPNCGDVATGQDMSDAFVQHPQTRSDGEPKMPADVFGRECIGRIMPGRGCNWVAYGLIPGPTFVIPPEGPALTAFRIAPAPGQEARA